jgi:DNA invertase Pin-like site-specific DNA recombinase
MKAWDNKEFDALVVDEVSRLARGPMELAKLEDRIEHSGVRLVTTNGVDSNIPNWQFQYAVLGAAAAQFVRDTRHRVIRGMIGQLERGYMIASPPFGYKCIREGGEHSGGTRWEIFEEEAVWVRKIFDWRQNGMALGGIAQQMNQAGIHCPRKPRKEAIAYWRPGTVRQMLHNHIYKGEFVWNGSARIKAKNKRENKPLNAEIVYERPHLRLVSDQIWTACNQSRFSRSGRSSSKHLFAGLVTCGICSATLSVATSGSAPALICAQCGQAGRVGVPNRKGSYVSTAGTKEVLLYVLKQQFTQAHIDAFRDRLRKRLEGHNENELVEIKMSIARLSRATERLLQLIRDVPDDDQLEQQYRATLDERRQAEKELKRVEAGIMALDEQAIEQQINVNFEDILLQLFDSDVSTERTRAVLTRVFTAIRFMGKPEPYTSVFNIEIVPGVIAAELTGTQELDKVKTVYNIKLSTTHSRPTRWVIQEI